MDAGTPEGLWQAALARAADWSPAPGRLLVVSPHPDDEVLGAGGLIHSWAARGGSVTVVSVTDGEAAYAGWPGLDLIRREELVSALRKLAPLHVSLLRIGLPDGAVRHHANRLRNALLALLEPSVTLIAPYEADGHPDHDTVGDVCCGLARAHDIAIARYPVWTWHHTDPPSMPELNWRRFALSRDAQRAKARAIECFASQLRPPHGAPIVPRHVLTYFERSYEAFIL